jgi:hypothetical protein
VAEIGFTLNGQVENSTSPNGTVAVSWPGLGSGDTGQPYSGHSYSDRSVQVVGTVGTGGNCRIEGSNDGVNWSPLSDPQGDALNLTGGLTAVTEISRFIRPNVTAGDGATDFTVILIGKR